MITNLTDLKKCVEWLKANEYTQTPGPWTAVRGELGGFKLLELAHQDWPTIAAVHRTGHHRYIDVCAWVVDELRAVQETEKARHPVVIISTREQAGELGFTDAYEECRRLGVTQVYDPSPEEPEEESAGCSVPTAINGEWHELPNGYDVKVGTGNGYGYAVHQGLERSIVDAIDSLLHYTRDFEADNDCEVDIRAVMVDGKRWEVRRV